MTGRSASSVEDGAGRPSHATLARVFLKMSLLGFGGPNAHLALMLDEVVERRRWIDREHFLQLMGLTNLLPGPNSSEVAIHVGYTQRGWPGALTTGLAFLLPTFVLVCALSAAYFRWGSVPALGPLFWALEAVVLALILRAGLTLARTAIDGVATLALAALGLGVGAAAETWIVPAMLLGAGLTWWTRGRGGREEPGGGGGAAERGDVAEPGDAGDAPRGRRGGALIALAPWAAQAAAAAGLAGVGSVLLLHLGIGAVMFGGGYVLVALLEPWAVGRFGWLTAAQFLDGVALTQAVPGPISTLSAFVGWSAAGLPGAVAGTAGLYLPAFAAVLVVAPHLEKLRRQEAVRAALAGVSAVVAGTMVGVAARLAPPALPDPWSVALCAVALLLLVRFRVQPSWLIAGALAVGAARALLA